MFGDPCSVDSMLRYNPPLPGTGPAGQGIPDMWLFLLSFQGHAKLRIWQVLTLLTRLSAFCFSCSI